MLLVGWCAEGGVRRVKNALERCVAVGGSWLYPSPSSRRPPRIRDARGEGERGTPLHPVRLLKAAPSGLTWFATSRRVGPLPPPPRAAGRIRHPQRTRRRPCLALLC